jgi:3-deoxy-manno-octulosonate cytidylyltransferase (CMP-KDO synthetase)
MDNLSFLGIIPARYASSRFPGKPLAMIGDKPMIQRVYEQAKKVLADVYVATDDNRIYDAVESFGGKAVMTSDKHRSGTDRCYEAYCNVSSKADVVINIQGDEPFIHEEQICEIMECFDDPATQIATLARKFDPSQGFDALNDCTKPKVAIDNNRNALYFSRSVIPFVRNAEKKDWPSETAFYMHVGMYAYKAAVLAEITKLPQSSLEIAESLEQLRWLQNGYKIKTGLTDKPTIGIDTPTDLEKAIRYLSEI